MPASDLAAATAATNVGAAIRIDTNEHKYVLADYFCLALRKSIGG